VLLLDEPLGALDKRLRQQLGGELRRIQRQTGVTTIYVTHDQDEAFAMSDRIAVMNHGRIRQLDSPETIYDEPADLFVAGFVGEVNALEGQVVAAGGTEAIVQLDCGIRATVATTGGVRTHDRVVCVVRPERISVWAPGSAGPPGIGELGEARILDSVFMGSVRHLQLQCGDRSFGVRVPGTQDLSAVTDHACFGWKPHDSALFAAQ
jgi:ABC-type Fe3+/spermidine/putrescine transport system ATPase subunit